MGREVVLVSKFSLVSIYKIHCFIISLLSFLSLGDFVSGCLLVVVAGFLSRNSPGGAGFLGRDGLALAGFLDGGTLDGGHADLLHVIQDHFVSENVGRNLVLLLHFLDRESGGLKLFLA